MRIVFALAILLFLTACTASNTPSLQITTTEIPGLESGESGSFTFQATSGTPPYTWSDNGNLPEGITLNAAGVISGSHTLSSGSSQLITPPFTITVTDSAGQTAKRDFSLTIIQAPPQLILTP